ncbi:MAG: hypothetical protein ACE5HI_08465, partial [bacterium]
DTDLPPLEISETRVNRLQKNVPEPFWQRVNKYKKMGVPQHLIVAIASSPRAPLFDALAKKFPIPPKRIVRYLFEKTVAWQRKKLPIEKLDDSIWHLFFTYANRQPALLEIGEELLEKFLQTKDFDLENKCKQFIPAQVKKSKLKEIVEKIARPHQANFSSKENQHRYLMGAVMEKCRGHIPGEQVSRILWRYLNKGGRGQ